MTKINIDELFRKRPLIIAGPCSAETEEQVLGTAKLLAESKKVDMFRAGIWKPRTRPGSFEGIGIEGLPWLQKVREQTGLPFCVEVATTKQAELALAFSPDMLWIGARTTASPVTVQEIADALKGTDTYVLIKNPINPELELWTGALERMLRSGIKNVGLIHRGFSVYGNMEYRYAPMWHLAIEMRRRNPDVLMICDPTHISGKRDLIQSVSQHAIDLDFDGLMIESHIDPDCALTDKNQQITPGRLNEILNSLIWRKEKSTEPQQNLALQQLRSQIDQIDDELLQLLGRRMSVADKIGLFKKENNITILQPERWNEILEKEIDKGAKLGLSPEFIKSYLEAVHGESINRQNSVIYEGKTGNK